MDETVVTLVEDQKDRQAFFDQKIAEGLFWRKVRLGDVVAEQLSLMPGVFFAECPGDVNLVEIEIVGRQPGGKTGPHCRILEFRQYGQRAILPDFVGKQKIEHR